MLSAVTQFRATTGTDYMQSLQRSVALIAVACTRWSLNWLRLVSVLQH
jgi:hypothetical protein